MLINHEVKNQLTQLNLLIQAEQLIPSMMNQIRSDIIVLAVYLTMKAEQPSIDSKFYNDLFELYKAVYLPCGYSRRKYKVL